MIHKKKEYADFGKGCHSFLFDGTVGRRAAEENVLLVTESQG